MSSSTTTTDAILLSRTPYREADWIVTLLGKNTGRVSAIARGARKSQRRFGGALQAYVVLRAEMQIVAHRDLATIRSAEVIETFPALAEDVDLMAQAGYATELVREWTAPGVVEPEVFVLLQDVYRTLRPGHNLVLRAFCLQLLDAIGSGANYSVCVDCGLALTPTTSVLLVPGQGGLIGECCANKEVHRHSCRTISTEVATLLATLQKSTLFEASNLQASSADLQIKRIVQNLVQLQLQRPLRSVVFAKQLAFSGASK